MVYYTLTEIWSCEGFCMTWTLGIVLCLGIAALSSFGLVFTFLVYRTIKQIQERVKRCIKDENRSGF